MTFCLRRISLPCCWWVWVRWHPTHGWLGSDWRNQVSRSRLLTRVGFSRSTRLLFDVVLSVEDGVKVGGVGSELSRLVSEAGGPAVEVLGVPREFLPLSSRALLLEEYGLDEEGIFLAARARISRFLRNTSEGSAPHKLPRT